MKMLVLKRNLQFLNKFKFENIFNLNFTFLVVILSFLRIIVMNTEDHLIRHI
jgi:hypothetical protein